MTANNLSMISAGGNDGLWNIISFVNTSSNYLFIYFVLLLIFITASYFFIKKTQDNSKSMLTASYIVAVLSLILYYAGKTNGTTVIPDLALLTILVLVAIGTAGLRYARNRI